MPVSGFTTKGGLGGYALPLDIVSLLTWPRGKLRRSMNILTITTMCRSQNIYSLLHHHGNIAGKLLRELQQYSRSVAYMSPVPAHAKRGVYRYRSVCSDGVHMVIAGLMLGHARSFSWCSLLQGKRSWGRTR
jgi:hypothetical protein